MVAIGELKAPRDSIVETLINLTRSDNNIVLLNADLEAPFRLSGYKEEFPENFFQVGCTEQNMASIAGGFATVGFIPFVTSFSCFISQRMLDQIFVSVLYPKLNVKFIGIYLGIFNGKNGATHQALSDISILRSFPNITILSPGDYIETKKCIEYSVRINGPVYIRVERDPSPVIFNDYKYSDKNLEEGTVLKEGKDLVIFSTGYMSHISLLAANQIQNEGISVKVVNITKLKPLNEAFILKCAKGINYIITCENHNIYGGFGSSIAEVFSKNNPKYISFFGPNDILLESASNEELIRKYKMDIDSLKILCKKHIRLKKI